MARLPYLLSVGTVAALAHTWFGCSARRRSVPRELVPSRECFGGVGCTQNPAARHSRCTRLRFTRQPSSRNRPQSGL